MVRFLIRCAAFAILLSLVLLALSQLPAPPREVSFLEAIHDKHRRLEETASPKLVIVGGSNVAFGMDSLQLESGTRIPVVNLGLNAGFGLKYMLSDVRPYLNAGDRLVVIPEYELFHRGEAGGAALATLLVDVDPSGVRRLTLLERVRLLEFVLPYLGRKAMYAIEVIGNRMLGRHVIDTGQAIYRRDAFNIRGDAQSHWRLGSREFPPMAPSPNVRINESIIEFLQQYCDELERDGIEVIILPPVLAAKSFDNLHDFIVDVTAKLRSASVPFAAQPSRYRFDEEFFFDTPYHLTKRGIDKRVTLLLDDLR